MDICRICAGFNTATNSLGYVKCLDCCYVITTNFGIHRSRENAFSDKYGTLIKKGHPDHFLIDSKTNQLKKIIRQMPLDKKREVGLTALRMGLSNDR